MPLITLYCAWCKKDSTPILDSAKVQGISVVEWFINDREEMCTSCYDVARLGKRQSITTHAKMLRYHMANPHVYEEMVKACKVLVDRPANIGRRLGIAMVFGFLRYEMARGTFDAYSHFKIQNNYQPHYARMLLLNNPGWKRIFTIKELFGKDN